MAQCKAMLTNGTRQCRSAAIAGATVCRKHGGGAPQVRAAAARRLALDEARGMVQRYGEAVDVTPEDAIFAMIRTAAGNVALLESLVATLEPEVGPGGIAGLTGNERITNEARRHVLVSMYDDERDRLVRFAKVAAEIGLSERMVRLAEAQGELIAKVFTAALEDPEWGLDPAAREEGKRVIGRHLRLVASNTA